MGNADRYLTRWVAEGVLDRETAERLLEFERRGPAPGGRPAITEAFVYLGLALIGAGVIAYLGLWGIFWETWAQISVPGFGAAFALGAGALLAMRRSPALRRGASVALLVSLALTLTTVGVVCAELGLDPARITIAAGAAGVIAAAALWLVRPTHASIVGIAAPLLVLSAGFSYEDGGEHALSTFGLALAGFGVTGVALTELGWLTPRATARVFAGLALGFGGFTGVSGAMVWTEAVPFIAGGALVVLSLRRGVFAYMALGVGTLFLGLTSAIVRHAGIFDTGALLLVVTGVVLIGGVLLLERLRPWAIDQRETAP
jgi:hypothetical protein